VSYGNVPADGVYLFTTFGGPGGGVMSCGGNADGSWPYMAGRARFGCGTKVLIEKDGVSCVAQVADCGPNRCVEDAACDCSCGGHTPTIAASPMIAEYLLGASSAGWSQKISVKATVVEPSSVIGCPGTAVFEPSGSGGSGGEPGSGGSAGAGLAGAPSSGGSSGAPECAPPVCACGSCYDDCFCDTGDAAHCADSCGLEAAAGSSSEPSPGTSTGCSGAPDCGGCGSCYDHCRCQYKSDAACQAECGGKADEIPSVETPPQAAPQPRGSGPGCVASIAPGGSRADAGAWLFGVALAFACWRRRGGFPAS
jgi:hypothetical protein